MTTPEIRALFRMHKPPAGLLADLVDYDHYHTVRLYRENFDKLTAMERLAAADWVQRAIESIRVITPCYLEVWKRPGVPGE